MALQTDHRLLSTDLNRAMGLANTIRARCVSTRNAMAARETAANVLLEFMDFLRVTRDELASISNRPGIGEYAKEQLGQDVTRDLAEIISAMDALITHLVAAMPKTSSDILLVEVMKRDGSREWVKFAPAETSTARRLIDALADTIED